MTPKEAFKKISISHEMMAYKYNYYLNHRDEGYQMCINPTWEQELDSIKQALTELEALKRDVKRYFELEQTHCELHEIDEYYDLYEKLSKVGEKE